jgi:hypothetical protein
MGLAGTLGMEHLALIAARMETALCQKPKDILLDDAFRADMDAVKMELTQLTAALPLKPIRKPSLAAKPMDPQSQQALLAELDTLLVLGDASVVALFDQHAVQLGAALGWTSEALGLQIKQFEFIAAHQTLQVLLKGGG